MAKDPTWLELFNLARAGELLTITSFEQPFVKSQDAVAAVFKVSQKTVARWFEEGCQGYENGKGYDLAAIQQFAIERLKTKDLDARTIMDSILEQAKGILKREPVLSDLDEDIVALIIRRLVRDGMRNDMIRRRLKWLRKIHAYATQRFNHPPIDFDSIPVTRRRVVDEFIHEMQPPPKLTDSEGNKRDE